MVNGKISQCILILSIGATFLLRRSKHHSSKCCFIYIYIISLIWKVKTGIRSRNTAIRIYNVMLAIIYGGYQGIAGQNYGKTDSFLSRNLVRCFYGLGVLPWTMDYMAFFHFRSDLKRDLKSFKLPPLWVEKTGKAVQVSSSEYANQKSRLIQPGTIIHWWDQTGGQTFSNRLYCLFFLTPKTLKALLRRKTIDQKSFLHKLTKKQQQRYRFKISIHFTIEKRVAQVPEKFLNITDCLPLP